MQSEDFRKLALELGDVEEKSHFGKIDFRVKNKIFAALKNAQIGVVKLRHEQQDMMMAAEPAIFTAASDGWGEKGWTQLNLAVADELTARSALLTAWRNVAPKSVQR